MSDVQTGPLCPTDRRIGWVEVGGVRHWVQRAELRRARDEKRQAWLLRRVRARAARVEQRRAWLLQRSDRRFTLSDALRRTVADCFEKELKSKPSPAHIEAILNVMTSIKIEGEVRRGLNYHLEWIEACYKLSLELYNTQEHIETLIKVYKEQQSMELGSSPGMQALYGDEETAQTYGMLKPFPGAEDLLEHIQAFRINYLDIDAKPKDWLKAQLAARNPEGIEYRRHAKRLAQVVEEALPSCDTRVTSVSQDGGSGARIVRRLLRKIHKKVPNASSIARGLR